MRNQILATITVNLLTLIYGISVGWAAPNIVLFQTESSPVGILTTSQVSLIASILCAGGVLGTFFYGWISDIWGRKCVLYLVALPQVLGLVMLVIGDNHNYIYASRLLLGLGGGGVSIVVPVFVAEISSENVRGALGSAIVLMQNIGVLVGFVLASYLDYHTMPYIVIGIAVAFFLLFLPFPDSPEFLGMQNSKEMSLKSYQFYGRSSTTNNLEMKGKGDLEGEKELAKPPTDLGKITWADFKDPAVHKGSFLAITLIIFADFCGSFVIINFLTHIFAAAHIELDIYVSTMIVGLIQIVGSSISTALIDRCGRRMLLMYSALGAGICLSALAVYFYLLTQPQHHALVHSFNWVPLAAVAGTILISTFGVTSLPFFILAELLPGKLRSLVSTLCLGISWACVFLILQFYQDLNAVIGIYGTMALFAICCFADIGFVYNFLPETKNLTFEEIRVKLSSGKGAK